MNVSEYRCIECDFLFERERRVWAEFSECPICGEETFSMKETASNGVEEDQLVMEFIP